MKIELKKERFEAIDGAFADMKESKSKRGPALQKIKRNLKETFNKDFDVTIIDANKGDRFLIMSIFPDQTTIDLVVEAIVDEKGDEAIRKAWLGTNKWTIEIDSRILNDSIVNATSKELTALLLHELGHAVYSNSIPQRISKVMRLEYARANVEVKTVLKDKLFRQILDLPIINACVYDNYRTKDKIKGELKADVFVVKMGYADELTSVLDKMIALTGPDKSQKVNEKSQDVYSDMKSATLFSLSTVEQFKKRQNNIVRANFKKLLFDAPSNFINAAVSKIQDVFINGSKDGEGFVTESVKDDFISKRANKLVDDYFQEMFLGPKKLKRIDPADLDYIQLETQNMKTNDDKMMLVSYIYSKLDIINYYITILDTQSGRYQVLNSRQELLSMKERLENMKKQVLEFKLPEVKYNFYVNYPDGYEG